MKHRTPYDKRVRKSFHTTGASLTKQAEKDDTDINLILKKYNRTGLMPHVNMLQGMYGDFSTANDYHASLNAVQRAQDAFMALPATIRSRFDNDPAAFLEFMSDDKNLDEAYSLGLAVRPFDQPMQSMTASELGAGETPAAP